MKDITSEKDIEHLVRRFYKKLLVLEDMQQVFSNIVLEEHIPRIVHFWSFVLLDAEGYKTNVFDKHLNLPITANQFDTWFQVFEENVQENFSGEKATMAIERARVLAFTFKSKWQSLKS